MMKKERKRRRAKVVSTSSRSRAREIAPRFSPGPQTMAASGVSRFLTRGPGDLSAALPLPGQRCFICVGHAAALPARASETGTICWPSGPSQSLHL